MKNGHKTPIHDFLAKKGLCDVMTSLFANTQHMLWSLEIFYSYIIIGLSYVIWKDLCDDHT